VGYNELLRLRPHLLILDISLSGMAIPQFITLVREVSTIPLLVITDTHEETEALQCLQAGADEFIVRPFSQKLLVARVMAHLRRAYRYNPRLVKPAEKSSTPGVPTIAATGSPVPGVPRQRKPLFPPQQQLPQLAFDPKLPHGWASCEACRYMGPQLKFQVTDALGRSTMICPHCRQSNFIVYATA
jgi:DNA-binding response OmpR family regulator